MKLLIVGMAQSVHLARLVSHVRDSGWDVHVFPSIGTTRVHHELSHCTVHLPPGVEANPDDPALRVVRLATGDAYERPVGWTDRVALLAGLIDELRPDIVHAHELQAAGYLVLDARHAVERFPPWIVTNWGTDMYWYGRDPGHRQRLRQVMVTCDYYAAECRRDVAIARAFGFRGPVLPVVPIRGGFDLEQIAALRAAGRTSDRTDVVLKGYHTGWGRARVGLAALLHCGKALQGRRIVVYLADAAMAAAVRTLGRRLGVATFVRSTLATERPSRDILAMHGAARVSIGLSATDGISSSFLEALAMGAFPVQSRTSCGAEWAAPGAAAFVDPDDSRSVARALWTALTDDDLVDRAAIANDRVTRGFLVADAVRRSAVDAYERVYEDAAVGAVPA